MSKVAQFLKNAVKWIVSLFVAPRWREKEGVIYFYVTSDGTTGSEWVKRLRKKGISVEEDAFHSFDFKPTSGETTKVAVLRGAMFGGEVVGTQEIYATAKHLELIELNAEVACLILEKFTHGVIEKMGLEFLTVMHKPIDVNGGYPVLLFMSDSVLTSDYAYQEAYDCGNGFAFACSR